MEEDKYSTIYLGEDGTSIKFKINAKTPQKKFDIILKIVSAMNEEISVDKDTSLELAEMRRERREALQSQKTQPELKETSNKNQVKKKKNKNKNKKNRIQQLKDSVNCIICRENKRDILFTPCNHICICEECSNKKIDNCIICKSVIQNKNKVYFP